MVTATAVPVGMRAVRPFPPPSTANNERGTGNGRAAYGLVRASGVWHGLEDRPQRRENDYGPGHNTVGVSKQIGSLPFLNVS